MSRLAALSSRRDLVPALLAAAAASLGRAPGAPSAVVLTAPAGAGKSYLLREFAGRVGLPVRHATPSPADSARPYAVATGLFGKLPEGVTADALLALVDELVASQSLVLIVDDLHLVDAASLGVLQDVLALGAPIVLLAAVQPGHDRPALDALLHTSTVTRWALPAFDRIDLDVFVHDVCDAWPSDAVRRRLAPAAGNALLLIETLDGLRAHGAAISDGVLELDTEPSGALPALGASIEQRLLGLAEPELLALQGVAVIGRPATASELAVVTGDSGPLAALTAAGLLHVNTYAASGEAVDFVHSSYRDAVYAAMGPGRREQLHRAAADIEPAGTGKTRHLIAAGTVPDELLGPGLADTPAVAADLIADAARQTTDITVAAGLAAARARALARSGQIRAAAEIATDALTWAKDPGAIAELRRVAIFTLNAGGRYADASAAVDRFLTEPRPESVTRLFNDTRRFLSVLDGRTPVPLTPIAPDPRATTMNGLMAEALRRYLLADTAVALEYAWAASNKEVAQSVARDEGLSADLWVSYVALAHQGPNDARAVWEQLVAVREQRDLNWLTAGHEVQRAHIELQSGHLDDAAAQFDSAITLAERLGLGGIRNAIATRAQIDVLRGDLPAARARLASGGGPSEFGLPMAARTQVAILEAERRFGPAADAARQAWRQAAGLNQRSWMAFTGPDFARVALRASDPDLLAEIADGLSGLDEAAGRPVRLSAQLAGLLAAAEYGRVSTEAPALAVEAEAAGLVMFAIIGREEAAVALAVDADRDAARAMARQAMAAAEDAGATAVAARIAGRLRAAGVRLGSAASRARPTFGWESLTPTEDRIVGLVAGGTPGPQIARQLHLSPRTVQTHVSHALGKLGLTNRVELAGAAARRAAEATG